MIFYLVIFLLAKISQKMQFCFCYNKMTMETDLDLAIVHLLSSIVCPHPISLLKEKAGIKKSTKDLPVCHTKKNVYAYIKNVDNVNPPLKP